MKFNKYWSQDQMRLPIVDVGQVYVNRIAPNPDGALVAWNKADGECAIWVAERDAEQFALAGKCFGEEFVISGLKTGKDYKFYVQCGDKKSLVRLFRTGDYVGTVINYLHPDDNSYLFSGKYVCSPTMVRLPDGALLAAHDFYGPEHCNSLSAVFRSEDDGKTWKHVCELFPCFWPTLFVHKGRLFCLACSTAQGDLVIGESKDGGHTFEGPVTLFRGLNGKEDWEGCLKCPMPITEHDGRLWTEMNWGTWRRKYAIMAASADVDGDLMDPANWAFTEPVYFDRNWPGMPEMTKDSWGMIEGNMFVKDGQLYELMRLNMHDCVGDKCGKAVLMKVNTKDPEAPLEYVSCIDFPANESKFYILFDDVTDCYYCMGNNLMELGLDMQNATFMPRNHLCLFKSKDSKNWTKVCDVLDARHLDEKKDGYQYPTFIFDGEDILFVSRTALNGAFRTHDSNCMTFHRLKNFRTLG